MDKNDISCNDINEIKKYLDINFNSGKLLKVKIKEKFYILRVFNNLTGNQIVNLEKEIKILSNLEKYHIEKYIDLKQQNDTYYLLSEFNEDMSLRKFINEYKKRNISIEEEIIYNIIAQICIALKVIHDNNLIHGNLKPENIFITKENNIKICNYKFNKNIKEESNDKYILSPYASPEKIKNENNLDNKIDIWSFGCIIFELLTLNYCFESNSKNMKELIDKIILGQHGKINLEKYNKKWQDLIDMILTNDLNKRANINQIIDYIINKLYEIKDKKEEELGYKYIYEGEYLFNERNGKAKMYWINNKKLKFEGEFINGIIWKGKEYNKNGNIIFEGEYLGDLDEKWNGKADGKFKMKNSDKHFFKGEFINGKMNGYLEISKSIYMILNYF